MLIAASWKVYGGYQNLKRVSQRNLLFYVALIKHNVVQRLFVLNRSWVVAMCEIQCVCYVVCAFGRVIHRK